MPDRKPWDMDWITIKYKDIWAIIGLILLVLVVGGGGYMAWRWKGNPQIQADRLLTKAQRLVESMDTPGAAPELRTTLNQVRSMVAQGRTEYNARRYQKALTIAKDALDTLRESQTASPSGQKFAVLLDVDGSVEVKRTGQHLFTSAKEQMILEDGDIVRTAQSSYARIKYHNGQIQIVNPDSLVVIQALTSLPDGASRVEVALKQGFVETQTPDTMSPKDESIIATDSTRIRPAPASRVAVIQDPSGQVTTSVFAGTSVVEAAGQSQTIQAGVSGVSVVSSATGIAAPSPLLAPPVAQFPRDQQILRVDDPVRYPITFEWQDAGTSSVRFQLSARPLFSSLITPEQSLTSSRLTVDGLPAGTYYWRLRSEGDPKRSFWSPIYRFRLLQIYQRPKIQRDLRLTVDATPIGDGLILQGSTDPGVSVSVNDIEIPVSADGTFSKIILFADVGTQAVHVRAFDDEGNEKIWRKSFQSVAY